MVLRHCLPLTLVVLLSTGALVSSSEPDVSPDRLSNLLSGRAPANVDELRAMQERIQTVTSRVIPTTVGVRVGHAHGSGVIVSKDGYVLTAAHVVGQPNRDAIIRLHDGRTVKGKTLGVFRTMDAGLILITTESEPWQHARFGDSEKLDPGQWCLATGHPGGFKPDRGPIVRVGRILSTKDPSTINTDCTLIGGDSGGPLFDMDGQVIGIHSRIGGPLTLNLHVPINVYREKWDRLVAADSWGNPLGPQPYLGVESDPQSTAAVVSRVVPGSAAELAGLRRGDLIRRFAGQPIPDFAALQRAVAAEQPGNHVIIQIERDNQIIKLEAIVGKRRETSHLD